MSEGGQGSPVRVERTTRLSDEQADAVRRIVNAAADADGVNPLSEHVLLHLRYGGEMGQHLLAVDGPTPVGYAHLDLSDEVEGASAELVVGPDHRNHGVGGQLARALMDEVGTGRLRLWAHGGQPAANALARKLGFVQARALWQMRRSLLAPLPASELPADIELRSFVVGEDEEGWTELNNRAFAGHPEQGRWTVKDVKVREQEPWFDPEGFLLAERRRPAGMRLVGFHWTKVHGGDDGPAHGHEPMGEVYIVGVDPDLHGQGLGKALTVAGLRHLRGRGLTQAMLYVDETNRSAIHVYESLGFAHWDTDVSYARGR